MPKTKHELKLELIETLEKLREQYKAHREAYKKAKTENDDRYMSERDEARWERDEARRLCETHRLARDELAKMLTEEVAAHAKTRRDLTEAFASAERWCGCSEAWFFAYEEAREGLDALRNSLREVNDAVTEVEARNEAVAAERDLAIKNFDLCWAESRKLVEELGASKAELEQLSGQRAYLYGLVLARNTELEAQKADYFEALERAAKAEVLLGVATAETERWTTKLRERDDRINEATRVLNDYYWRRS